MALLDEFEQKFARQYRAWEEERAALQHELDTLKKDARQRAASARGALGGAPRRSTDTEGETTLCSSIQPACMSSKMPN
jgi:hypothetical protein